jgi:plasmid maintenance system antidote protein VapI
VTKKIAEVWPVSAFILEEMEAKGWDAHKLWKESELQWHRVKAIIYESAKINVRDANGLAKAFHTSSEYWQNLQKLWYIGLQIQMQDEFEEKMKANKDYQEENNG